MNVLLAYYMSGIFVSGPGTTTGDPRGLPCTPASAASSATSPRGRAAAPPVAAAAESPTATTIAAGTRRRGRQPTTAGVLRGRPATTATAAATRTTGAAGFRATGASEAEPREEGDTNDSFYTFICAVDGIGDTGLCSTYLHSTARQKSFSQVPRIAG